MNSSLLFIQIQYTRNRVGIRSTLSHCYSLVNVFLMCSPFANVFQHRKRSLSGMEQWRSDTFRCMGRDLFQGPYIPTNLIGKKNHLCFAEINLVINL